MQIKDFLGQGHSIHQGFVGFVNSLNFVGFVVLGGFAGLVDFLVFVGSVGFVRSQPAALTFTTLETLNHGSCMIMDHG